jgi:hypothetical protein
MDDIPAAVPNANPPPSARRGSRLAKAAGLLVLVALVANGIASHSDEVGADRATAPSARLAAPPGPDLGALPGSLGEELRGTLHAPSLGECGSVLVDNVRWTPGECTASDDVIVVKLVKGEVLMWPDAHNASDIRRIAQRGCPETTQYFTSHGAKGSLPSVDDEGQIKAGVVIACWAAR